MDVKEAVVGGQKDYYPRKNINKRKAIVQKENGIFYEHLRNDMKTTHGESFPPRENSVARTLPFIPVNKRETLAALENKTVTRSDYVNFGNQARSKPILPKSNSVVSKEPMQSTTSYQESHTPKPVSPMTKPEWAQKKPYEAPVNKLPDVTTYKETFVKMQTPRPDPKKHDDNEIFSKENVNYRTMYENAYSSRQNSKKRMPIKHIDNIQLSSDKFQGASVYKDHYNGYDKKQTFSKAKTMTEMTEKYSKMTAPAEENCQDVGAQSKPVRLAPLTNRPSLPSQS
ncbi:DgyrCDS2334 [Dimorphilus gyrociliatus]|uniref:DgyrCDS2334 n=1 Tax=Dimorphilus gyrociliatus TaxID=2664684 RepID=A0A7I8VF36_9ANNE|nr:DgyrCDS2334 [Dimorphilus gyrociliatus]